MADDQAAASPPTSGTQSVQLGIGTLIIIAIIVSMCSGSSEVQKLRGETTELKQQVREVNRKLDELLARNASATAVGVEAPDAPAGPAASPDSPER